MAGQPQHLVSKREADTRTKWTAITSETSAAEADVKPFCCCSYYYYFWPRKHQQQPRSLDERRGPSFAFPLSSAFPPSLSISLLRVHMTASAQSFPSSWCCHNYRQYSRWFARIKKKYPTEAGSSFSASKISTSTRTGGVSTFPS